MGVRGPAVGSKPAEDPFPKEKTRHGEGVDGVYSGNDAGGLPGSGVGSLLSLGMPLPPILKVAERQRRAGSVAGEEKSDSHPCRGQKPRARGGLTMLLAVTAELGPVPSSSRGRGTWRGPQQALPEWKCRPRRRRPWSWCTRWPWRPRRRGWRCARWRGWRFQRWRG
uniref:Uncharacterized protein n=1 Tax=Arundo donax TaxID=35708 RepID=A0A0A9C069_ARUDO